MSERWMSSAASHWWLESSEEREGLSKQPEPKILLPLLPLPQSVKILCTLVHWIQLWQDEGLGYTKDPTIPCTSRAILFFTGIDSFLQPTVPVAEPGVG